MSSTRLPGKVLMDLVGKPMIIYQLNRIKRCKSLDEVILATSTDPADDLLTFKVQEAGFSVFRGSLNDVLDRYRACAASQNATAVVRLTGDCPFSDHRLVDELVDAFYKGNWDYLSNCALSQQLSVPDGFDAEIFSADILERAASEAHLPSEREHVTPWFRSDRAGLRWGHFRHQPIRPYYRVTVDDPIDLTVVRSIASALEPENPDFGVEEVVNYLNQNPEIAALNLATVRNEGYLKSLQNDQDTSTSLALIKGQGQELWRRAKRVIPGGNMLLSKRAEMFLPELWPAYFTRAKGCRVWDLDGRELIDFSIMGIGTNLLGYGHPEVDSAVAAVVAAGNMSTLNCPEEVLLAERLVAMHPWAEMVRFARSGGEANAIAIRIARAATGRETVAICGYHGWHDWYLASNLQNESGLEEHLLPGLEPNGVPSSLAGTVQPFSYNQFHQLEAIAHKYNLAAVKMEVQRSTPPDDGFLENVRDLCNRKGIVLIFDECTSGFRETFGGLHLKYGVDPDIAMFGKALGNGYAITSVIGRRAVMEAAQSTFISSTFWTERIGSAAALKTLEVMHREHSWEKVTAIGRALRSRWQEIADRHGLRICHNGIPALTGFTFQSSNSLKYKTLISQEMLRKGYLATTSCYICLDHTPSLIEPYLDALDVVFALIADCEQGRSVDNLLEGPVCHSGFKRLN
ncbi:N-acylneuraminate cytidylyltransferase/pyridoxal phosphate-dependent transferase domain-containing protein [Synechococcus sp. A18-40]|nr:N-acylneuraminate cytidylyltransferase/pyridoxal phosphate-dependent transferase domain-containing protein [Synechococcus sp. A18-40]